MDPLSGGGRDVLVAAIAESLERDGQYVTLVDGGSEQQLVDLRWCAHRAGDRLGMKVRVTVADPPFGSRRARDSQLTMTVVPRCMKTPGASQPSVGSSR